MFRKDKADQRKRILRYLENKFCPKNVDYISTKNYIAKVCNHLKYTYDVIKIKYQGEVFVNVI